MKLGNISQTVVQVPNFFMNRGDHPIETFEINHLKTESNINSLPKKIEKKKNLSLKQKLKTELELDSTFSLKSKIKNKHIRKRNTNFSDNKILTTYYDININNNPRYKPRYWININKEKYIPNYYCINNNNTFINKTQTNVNYFPGIIDMNKLKEKNINKKHKRNDTYTMANKFYNYTKYKNDTNMNKLLSPDLRGELMNDTRNLIDKINMNYDLTSWNKFDTRTTSNRLIQTEYSPITNVVKNTTNIRDKFINTISQKVLGLNTINNNVKKNNIKIFYQRNIEDEDNNNKKENSFDALLDKNKSNLLKLKNNNTTKLEYKENDKRFITENEYITKKLNKQNKKSNLYKEFPSKTREEFNTKKILKFKELFKINKQINNLISKDKYGGNYDNIINDKIWIRPLHKDAFKINN